MVCMLDLIDRCFALYFAYFSISKNKIIYFYITTSVFVVIPTYLTCLCAVS